MLSRTISCGRSSTLLTATPFIRLSSRLNALLPSASLSCRIAAGGQRKVVVAHHAHVPGHAQAQTSQLGQHPPGDAVAGAQDGCRALRKKMRHVFARTVLFIIPIGHHPFVGGKPAQPGGVQESQPPFLRHH